MKLPTGREDDLVSGVESSAPRDHRESNSLELCDLGNLLAKSPLTWKQSSTISREILFLPKHENYFLDFMEIERLLIFKTYYWDN